MLDWDLYKPIFDCIEDSLTRDRQVRNYGRKWCDMMIANLDPRTSAKTERNAEEFLVEFVRELKHQNRGDTRPRDAQQIYDIVGALLRDTYTLMTEEESPRRSRRDDDDGWGRSSRRERGFGTPRRRTGFRDDDRRYSRSNTDKYTGSEEEEETRPPREDTSRAPRDEPAAERGPSVEKVRISSTMTIVPNPLEDANGDTKITDLTSPEDQGPVVSLKNADFNHCAKNIHRGFVSDCDVKITMGQLEYKPLVDDSFEIARTFFEGLSEKDKWGVWIYRVQYERLRRIPISFTMYQSIVEEISKRISGPSDDNLISVVLSELDRLPKGTWTQISNFLVDLINERFDQYLRTMSHMHLFLKIEELSDIHTITNTTFVHPIAADPSWGLTVNGIISRVFRMVFIEPKLRSWDPNTPIADVPIDMIMGTRLIPSCKTQFGFTKAGMISQLQQTNAAVTSFTHWLNEKYTFISTEENVVITNMLGLPALREFQTQPVDLTGEGNISFFIRILERLLSHHPNAINIRATDTIAKYGTTIYATLYKHQPSDFLKELHVAVPMNTGAGITMPFSAPARIFGL